MMLTWYATRVQRLRDCIRALTGVEYMLLGALVVVVAVNGASAATRSPALFSDKVTCSW